MAPKTKTKTTTASPDVYRKVVMTNTVTAPDGRVIEHKATDYVPLNWPLATYLADAKTRWTSVEDSPDDRT